MCGLFAACLALAPAMAQDENSGYLEIDAGPRGDARVSLWLQGAETRGLADRLSKALPCALKLQPVQNPGYATFEGTCPGLFHREGSLVRGRIDLQPILAAVALKEPSYFSVEVKLPSAALKRCGPWQSSPYLPYDSACQTTVTVGSESDTAADLAYGFRPSDLGWRFGILGVLVLAPIPLLLRRRRRVLATEGEERLTAWFGYWRTYRVLHQGGWLLWIVLLYALRLDDWPAFLVDGSLAAEILLFALLALPPALVYLLGHHLSQPVFAHVRELSRTPREARGEALSYLLIGLVPLAMYLVGITATGDRIEAMAAWVLIGLVTMVLGRIALLRSTRMIPQAVTLGELRDRIFGMARKVRVKLQQIYILPASRMRMANAFATAGNSVILTDYLLAHLNRREVEAVVAHEVAHLRHRHPRLLGLAMAGILVAWMIGSAFFDAVSPLGWFRPFAGVDLTIDLLPLFLLAGLLPLRLLMRRFERSADAYAAMLTGDPEAMISALGKLARLSLLPMRWTWWEDRVSTHPSMIRRGEALALRFGLSYDRMEQLLRGEAGLPEDRYELPDAMSPDRVFTTEHKTRAGLAVLLAVLGVTSGTGILTSWWVHRAGLGIDQSWWIYGLALLGGWAALVLLMNLLGPRGEDELARKLAARFEREGISPDALGGVFVGFAPDDSPRLYEGHGVWDVGFLLPGREGLVYLGDQTRFRLGHVQVEAVRLGPGTPSWWRVGSVYIDWRSPEGWTRTFHLRGRGRTLLAIRRSTKQLAERLSAWLTSPEGSPELPAALAELPPPVVAEVTGLFPREALRPRNLLIVCWLIFVLTFFVSLLIGNWDGSLTALVLAMALYFAQIVPYFFAEGPGKKKAGVREEGTIPS